MAGVLVSPKEFGLYSLCLFKIFVYFIYLAVSGLGCGAQALKLHTGLVVTQRVGSQFTKQGLNTLPPALEGRLLTTGPPGESLDFIPCVAQRVVIRRV